MSNKIYTIPGWGFNNDIFNLSFANDFNLINLSYDINLSIERNIIKLSKILPEDSTILGWSIGGLFAIKLANKFPNKVKKIILIATQAKLASDHNWQGIQQDSINRFTNNSKDNYEKQKTLFYKLAAFPNLKIKLLLQEFHIYKNNKLTYFLHLDLRNEYKEIYGEILHIFNEKDLIIPAARKQSQILNPKAKTVSISNAGHAGFLTHRQEYINLIREFCHE